MVEHKTSENIEKQPLWELLKSMVSVPFRMGIYSFIGGVTGCITSLYSVTATPFILLGGIKKAFSQKTRDDRPVFMTYLRLKESGKPERFLSPVRLGILFLDKKQNPYIHREAATVCVGASVTVLSTVGAFAIAALSDYDSLPRNFLALTVSFGAVSGVMEGVSGAFYDSGLEFSASARRLLDAMRVNSANAKDKHRVRELEKQLKQLQNPDETAEIIDEGPKNYDGVKVRPYGWKTEDKKEAAPSPEA